MCNLVYCIFQIDPRSQGDPATCNWHQDKGTNMAGTRKLPRDHLSQCAKEMQNNLK